MIDSTGVTLDSKLYLVKITNNGKMFLYNFDTVIKNQSLYQILH
jgi:hypothetical protein